MSGPFKMRGHTLPGPNQRSSPAKQKRIIKRTIKGAKRTIKGAKSLYESGKKHGGIMRDMLKYAFKHGTFSIEEKRRRRTDPKWIKKEAEQWRSIRKRRDE